MNGMDDEIKEEPTIKLYVHDDNHITFNCHECGYSKLIDLSIFKKIKTEMKFKCKCSTIVNCLIEFRKKYRKEVSLNGSYRDLKTGIVLPMEIKDISIGGIRFTCFMGPNIMVGDMTHMTFQLDDSKKTEIRLTGEVKWVNNRNVGLKFRELSGYQKDLGFYFMK